MTTTAPFEAALPPPAALLASPATRRFLTRYVARRVPACDVDDVVQATLCDAIASGRAPRQPHDLHRWLLAIARYKVVDVHRAAARAVPGETGELPAPALPVEALSLMRWAERQLPRGAATEATLRWMVREAEGDKLEAIAADEALPPERVRQRVSRLRRWMRERWMLELAAVAALAVVVASVAAATRHRYETVLPEGAPEGPAQDATPLEKRLTGTWRLEAFTPAAPLPGEQQALLDRVASSLTVRFDGRALEITATGGLGRSYAVTAAGGGRIDAAEAGGQHVGVTYAWDADDLVVTVPSGRWAGVARLRAAR